MLIALVLLAVSLAMGALTFRWAFRKLLARALRRGDATHLADASAIDWPGLVSLMLPRGPRAAWNLVVLVVVTLLLAVPHWLAIGRLTVEADAAAYDWWLATLPWWLLLTGLPAMVCARHAAYVSARPSPPS